MDKVENAQALDVSEACGRLHCSRRYLYVMIRRGELQSWTMGRARRILKSSIDEYIARRLDAERETGTQAADSR